MTITRIGRAASVDDTRYHSDALRSLADEVDAGRVLVFGYAAVDSEGRIHVSSNRIAGVSDFSEVQMIAAASLLHDQAVRRVREILDDSDED